jgi:hypothetical protein
VAAAPQFDWDALRRFADALTPERRVRIRDEWTLAAQAEHASIASFDRFSLQLLALGAPPTLLLQSHQAAIDEVNHAQISFAIASVYAGQSLGPGALALDGRAFADFTLSFVVQSAVAEGCVGETLAAIEAEAAGEGAQSDVLRQALSLIAADEAEHAALAYRFAAWAVGAFGDEARRAANQGLITRFPSRIRR